MSAAGSGVADLMVAVGVAPAGGLALVLTITAVPTTMAVPITIGVTGGELSNGRQSAA